MKKLTIIVLTFIYLIPAIGVSMDVHWCCNRIKIVDINSSHEKKCPCGKKMPPGCCKDYHFSAKITQIQQSLDQIKIPSCDFITVFSLDNYISLFTIPLQAFVFDFSMRHPPPFKCKQPVYLDISVFRI